MYSNRKFKYSGKPVRLNDDPSPIEQLHKHFK